MSAIALAASLLAAIAAHAHTDFHNRIKQVSEEIRAQPERAELYIKRAGVYRNHGDWAEALSDLDKAAELAPDRPLNFYAGRVHLAADDLPKAEREFRAQLQAVPGHSDSHLYLGRTLLRRNQPAPAAQHFTLAINTAARPEPSDYLERASAQKAVGPAAFDEAVVGLEQGLQQLGNVLSLQRALIELEAARGKIDAALWRLDFVAASQQRPERWLAWKGRIQQQHGRESAARESYQAALAAIHALPRGRRETSGSRKLEAELQAALVRLQ
jgi:Tfp pilus assembly protein PilF